MWGGRSRIEERRVSVLGGKEFQSGMSSSESRDLSERKISNHKGEASLSIWWVPIRVRLGNFSSSGRSQEPTETEQATPSDTQVPGKRRWREEQPLIFGANYDGW